jgi:hypothetical protein
VSAIALSLNPFTRGRSHSNGAVAVRSWYATWICRARLSIGRRGAGFGAGRKEEPNISAGSDACRSCLSSNGTGCCTLARDVYAVPLAAPDRARIRNWNGSRGPSEPETCPAPSVKVAEPRQRCRRTERQSQPMLPRTRISFHNPPNSPRLARHKGRRGGQRIALCLASRGGWLISGRRRSTYRINVRSCTCVPERRKFESKPSVRKRFNVRQSSRLAGFVRPSSFP